MNKTMARLVLSGLSLIGLSSPLSAQGIINAVDTLPGPVKAVYLRVCPLDSWIGNKRTLHGSTSKTFSDGSRVFLMICGDAAATIPFSAIVLNPTGEAAEAHFQWRWQGKNREAAFGNARFGTQPNTVVSSAHSSAKCNPAFTHHWDGTGFQLVAYNRQGCDDDE